jgi:hypothetical protein
MAVFSVIFISIRSFISLKYPDWLHNSLNFFINWDTALNLGIGYNIFGWFLIIFITITILSLIVYYRYYD